MNAGAVDIFHAAATPDGEGVGVHEGPHQHALRTEASATAHALYHQGDRVGGDLVYSKVSRTKRTHRFGAHSVMLLDLLNLYVHVN